MVKSLVRLPHDKPRIGVLRGYAGTGKTTMIRVLGAELGELVIVAPTGKAAVRVTEATGLPAMTIHRFIYAPNEDPLTGKVTYSRKDIEEIHCPSSKLIVIEEASMVGEQMFDDIYNVAHELGCHILCVGDPFQLPPVEVEKVDSNGPPFGLLLPNFKFDLQADLTEITRQALESPIIRASMKLRFGDAAEAIMEMPRVRPADMLAKHLELLDRNGVVICHRNSSRHELNRRIREHKNLSQSSLHDGEPLLVLRNNYQLQRFNGEVLRFDGWKRQPGKQYEIYDRWREAIDHASFGLATVEGGEECGLVPKAVFGSLDKISVSAIEQVARTALGPKVPYLHCSFGYTLTAHKSQGSEWKDVMVVVERSVQPYTKDGRRWLYTAVTRARENVSIVWLAGANDEQIT